MIDDFSDVMIFDVNDMTEVMVIFMIGSVNYIDRVMIDVIINVMTDDAAILSRLIILSQNSFP